MALPQKQLVPLALFSFSKSLLCEFFLLGRAWTGTYTHPAGRIARVAPPATRDQREASLHGIERVELDRNDDYFRWMENNRRRSGPDDSARSTRSAGRTSENDDLLKSLGGAKSKSFVASWRPITTGVTESSTKSFEVSSVKLMISGI